MRLILLLTSLTISVSIFATEKNGSAEVVTIPYMERPAAHREYADVLLNLALKSSEDLYGPYKIIQQREQTVMLRQLQELEKGENLSVAVSMPMIESLNKAHRIQFPILRGLSSYRMFLVHNKNLALANSVDSIDALRTFKIGQGPGWSTAKILEDNGFHVVYSGRYDTLIPMLQADRFQLFMRAAYEIEPELDSFNSEMPELRIVDNVAVYTYLPMYFFVSKKNPLLAERLEYGLKKVYANRQFDKLYMQYFGDTLKLINASKRKIYYLKNTNINASFYEQDKPYLLEPIKKLETTLRP